MEQTDGRLMCWDPQDGIPHFPYVFVPGMPMTFTITFSLPSLVDDVKFSVVTPFGGMVAYSGEDELERGERAEAVTKPA